MSLSEIVDLVLQPNKDFMVHKISERKIRNTQIRHVSK